MAEVGVAVMTAEEAEAELAEDEAVVTAASRGGWTAGDRVAACPHGLRARRRHRPTLLQNHAPEAHDHLRQ